MCRANLFLDAVGRQSLLPVKHISRIYICIAAPLISYAASIIYFRKVFVGLKERRRSCSQSTRGAMFARALETRFAKSHRCYMRPKPALRHFRGRLRLYAALGTGRSNGTRRRAQFLARLSQRTEMQLLLFRQCAFYRTAATSIRA